MKIEKQVVSFEVAVKLKKEGVTQAIEGYYHWVMPDDTRQIVAYANPLRAKKLYAAYSVAELGVLIPASFSLPIFVLKELVQPGQIEGKWSCRLIGSSQWQNFETEVEARGALLLNLLEKEMISVKEINERFYYL